ncbi:MAG: sulfite exporter TauE/SafE family protein [Candidatus Ratteibacteria bacterium]|nr:sulfite exporter TauE/SafE family protein [Candidatus Ratteibacteria bacterium]
MGLWIEGVLTGLVAGFICGLFGMGGGSLMVPAIVYVFNLPMKQAVGTSLFVIIFSSMSALINYIRNNKVSRKLVLFIVPAGIAGAQAGALLTSRLSDILVKYIFVVVIAGLGIKMFFEKENSSSCEGGNFNKITAIVIGLLSGFVSGLCGVGGAVLIIPLLYIFLRVPMHTCIGTSVVVILFNAISGATGYITRGLVNFQIGVMLAIGSTVAAPLGARISIRTDREKLRKMFAVVLILSGLSVLFK